MGVTLIEDQHPASSESARGGARTWPWWLALALALAALAIGSGPGVDVSWKFVRLSAHNPRPPAALAALIALSAVLWRRRLTWTADLPSLADDVRKRPRLVAGLVAGALVATGVAWNTWTIGGSDSHCYAAQARAFATGRVHVVEPAALDAPWPDATRTFAPVGFLPSPSTPGELLPVCAPGYSVLLAPLVALWPVLQFLVPPLSAAVVIWAAFRLARSLEDDPITAVGAAVLVASAPIVLYQAVQPMTDVPVTAAIAAAAVFAWTSPRRPGLAGLALGIGLLIRPNLLPVVLVFLWSMADRASRPALGRFLAAFVPVAGVVPVLNALVYGAPWRTGYGDTSALFSIAHVPTNLQRYTTWTLDTMTPLVLLIVFVPWLLARNTQATPRHLPSGDWQSPRRISLFLLSLIAIISGCYVAYVPFVEWWYLRFLLPAIPLLCVLMAVAIVVLGRRAGRIGGLVALAVFGALAWHGLSVARHRAAFDLWHLEQRLSATATYIRGIAPNVVAITIQPGGAIRYELERPVVSWDTLEPQLLDRVVSWAGDRGDRALIVIDGAEAAEFRARFSSSSAYGALEWPPRAVIDRTVLIYDPADRARYLTGEYVPTVRVDAVQRPARR